MAANHVHQLLDEACQDAPVAVAVTDGTARWTYRELADVTSRVHCWLSAQAVRPGDRVIVATPSSGYTMALVFACSRLGAIFTPVADTIRPYRFHRIAADAEPTLTICGDGLLEPRRAPGRVVSLTRLLSELPGRAADVPVRQHPVAFLLYTSGSSGTPKGVICSHAQVLAAVTAIGRLLRYRPDDVVYCRLPFSFDYGLYQALLSTQARCELVLDPERPVIGLLAALRACRATVVPVVPPLAAAIGWFAERQARPESVRLFTSTGSAMPPSTLQSLRRWFPAARISLMYGLTECKRATMTDPAEEDPRQDTSVGKAIGGAEIRILAEGVLSAEPNRAGEIVVSGPQVMTGYWRADELTAARFRVDPDGGAQRLHTGDLGYLDEAGRLHVLGRLDNTFNHRSVRMSAEEIEAAAMDIVGVREAVLQPPTDAAGMVLHVIGSVPPAEVLRGIGDRLGPARTPEQCRIADEFPRTASGKADRRALLEDMRSRKLRGRHA